jgi:hypothetical protein
LEVDIEVLRGADHGVAESESCDREFSGMKKGSLSALNQWLPLATMSLTVAGPATRGLRRSWITMCW